MRNAEGRVRNREYRGKRIRVFCVLLIFVLWTGGKAAASEDIQLWWPEAGLLAEQNGYKLIRMAQLEILLASDEDTLLLDVRPDYEYQAGHIDKALNQEFHLGQRNALEPERLERLKRLAGEDRQRPIVVYCRNFR